MEFLTIFGKDVAKIEPCEITSFFYNKFFHFGGMLPLSPSGGAYVLAFFKTNLTNHALIFREFGRKPQTIGKFLEGFKKFIERIAKKYIILAYVSKRLNNPCVTFSRVWTKTPNCWHIFRNSQ